MGLDGGTYITRSDVLRGQSWELNNAENSRSTRGGAVTGVYKKAKLDPKLERCYTSAREHLADPSYPY